MFDMEGCVQLFPDRQAAAGDVRGRNLSETITLILEFKMKNGLEREASQDMAAVLAAIPQGSGIGYTFYSDPLTPRSVHAVETHPDSQSLIDHMGRVGPLLAKSRETADLVSMRVLGNVSPLLAHILGKMGAQAIPEWTPGDGPPAI